MLLTGLGFSLRLEAKKDIWKRICKPVPKADVLRYVGPISSIPCKILVGQIKGLFILCIKNQKTVKNEVHNFDKHVMHFLNDKAK